MLASTYTEGTVKDLKRKASRARSTLLLLHERNCLKCLTNESLWYVIDVNCDTVTMLKTKQKYTMTKTKNKHDQILMLEKPCLYCYPYSDSTKQYQPKAGLVCPT